MVLMLGSLGTQILITLAAEQYGPQKKRCGASVIICEEVSYGVVRIANADRLCKWPVK